LPDVALKDILKDPKAYITNHEHDGIYVICRLGNDSQTAAESLRAVASDIVIKDVVGGLRAWSKTIDPDFPYY
jgi:adenylyltransferase/sulfurtransferase